MEAKQIKEEPEAKENQPVRLKPTNNKGKEDGHRDRGEQQTMNSANAGSPTQTTNGNASPPLSGSCGGLDMGHHQGVIKVKRLLSTLVQYGHELAPETGDRVRSLVLSLVSGSVSLDEFHQSLVDTTSYPLRPFVVPFLRAYLPSLQKDIALQARSAKQGELEYLACHESVVLDPSFMTGGHSSELFTSHPAREESSTTINHKRRYDSGGLPYDDEYPAKRPLLVHPGGSLDSECHATTQQQHHNYTPAQRQGAYNAEEQWRNIHVMLNCILSMVDKTKRALGMLQGRNGSTVDDWRSPLEDVGGKRVAGHAGVAAAHDLMAQTIRITEDRVAQVKRKAEEAVAEVKRQAVAELQRAVAAAETKASQLVAAEQARLERLVAESHRRTAAAGPPPAHPLAPAHNQHHNSATPTADEPPLVHDPNNSCWNCGRKANDTCSGCNVARYCGSFCQHKDWESHHQVCCGAKQSAAQNRSPTSTNQTSRSSTPLGPTPPPPPAPPTTPK